MSPIPVSRSPRDICAHKVCIFPSHFFNARESTVYLHCILYLAACPYVAQQPLLINIWSFPFFAFSQDLVFHCMDVPKSI